MTPEMEELIEAADAVWADAAEGGASEVAHVSGFNIRRLALAAIACDPGSFDADASTLAEQWPEATRD